MPMKFVGGIDRIFSVGLGYSQFRGLRPNCSSEVVVQVGQPAHEQILRATSEIQGLRTRRNGWQEGAKPSYVHLCSRFQKRC